jgi:hypothetical protein
MKFFQAITSKYQIEARGLKNVDPAGKTLQQWMKATGVTFGDMKMQWGLDDYDIMRRHGIEENEEDPDETSDQIEKAFAADVYDKYEEWKYKYGKLKFPLTLYRAVCVKKLEDIKLNKLGTDWTDSLDSASCYHGHIAPPGSTTFVIKAIVKRTDVDWSGTVWNNLNESFGEDEQEINLVRGKTVQVVEIQTKDEKWIKVNKPGKV